MVKENLIPKTETVYELKDKYEVPSFEEFMKTYKHDGNLNYADLNSGNVGEVKGYGPCQICSDKPEQESYLYMSCPGINDNGVACGNPNKSYWYHSTDNAKTKITNRAQIKCSSCSTSAHISYWRFRCSRHEGGKYYQTSKLEFKKALTLIIGAEPYIGTTMSDDIITYIAHPDHRNEGRMGW